MASRLRVIEVARGAWWVELRRHHLEVRSVESLIRMRDERRERGGARSVRVSCARDVLFVGVVIRKHACADAGGRALTPGAPRSHEQLIGLERIALIPMIFGCRFYYRVERRLSLRGSKSRRGILDGVPLFELLHGK